MFVYNLYQIGKQKVKFVPVVMDIHVAVRIILTVKICLWLFKNIFFELYSYL